jgi:hypothetical protein
VIADIPRKLGVGEIRSCSTTRQTAGRPHFAEFVLESTKEAEHNATDTLKP